MVPGFAPEIGLLVSPENYLTHLKRVVRPFARAHPSLDLEEFSSTFAANSREPREGFDVVGLGKAIEKLQTVETVTVLEQET